MRYGTFNIMKLLNTILYDMRVGSGVFRNCSREVREIVIAELVSPMLERVYNQVRLPVLQSTRNTQNLSKPRY